ncbi:hypothetical protein GobsT_67050 [Gemmata obscuriglobus]|uniref:Uncharacterized protein n=1 Tax=Gemmata obscuriglobus TaxID=114 RepID=A0A2Z3GW62_9BACT|nr:hypothetical protein [Gemmata obscuriglobus]AWM35616.1 hypothetical protein C1280_00305 [Gemmata obscuriglobus]QEG31858.1 hypothetical protein GobsT_67050 [Gemmata obscuriglobus]VTS11204.1 unnamed protein product [Gemmata obscuriglobus UQM 2246]
MRQTLFVALVSATVAPGPAQERQPPPVRPAARLAQVEEEAEVLEAERDVNKAHIKAAEVGVKAAELGAVRLKKALGGGALAVEEFDRAKLEVKMALNWRSASPS